MRSTSWTAAFRDAVTEQRQGDWMQTYTGIAFWPLDPRPEEVCPLDIAAALSKLCRYGGHSRRFYSVAEHCVLMARALPWHLRLQALLHDAAEAYVADVPRPLKQHIPGYDLLERRVHEAVCRRFAIPATLDPRVKEADERILVDEMRQAMMGRPPRPWKIKLEPLDVELKFWTPARAEKEYLADLKSAMTDTRATP